MTGGDKPMFPNLRAEMARQGLSVKDVAEKINVDKTWLENRLNGKCTMQIETALDIWSKCFPSVKLDYLFAKTAIIPFCSYVSENGNQKKCDNKKAEA